MEGESLERRLKRWGYPSAVNERVTPVLLRAQDGITSFERAVWNFAEHVLRELQSEKIHAKEADDLFMVIDLYVSECNLRESLSEDLQQLIFEGLLLHDFGTVHGPDLSLMAELCKKHVKVKG